MPVGERIPPITPNTDSPATPRITLNFRMLGSRKPFLLDIEGDLAYVADSSEAETRQIVVTTVEGPERRESPAPRSDPEFLKYERINVTEKAYVEPNTYVRRYAFRVGFTSSPPSGAFSGLVSVEDPWDHTRIDSINAYSQAIPAIRMVPAHTTLKLVAPADKAAHARFAVVTTEVIKGLTIEDQTDVNGRFVDERVPGEGTPQMMIFLARPGPDASPVPDLHRLIVRDAEGV